MKHIPHLVVGGPWDGQTVPLTNEQWHHLTKVLRMKSGDRVTYTDGRGRLGEGVLGAERMERGDEEMIERPTNLTIAVAPPASKDRQRFLVEKLAEVGVARLIWLETQHGTNRLAGSSKIASWARGALEQSRGAHLMEISDDLVGLDEIEGRLVLCQPGGEPDPGEFDVIAVGPEGGFAEGEIPHDARLWDLGPTVLRVETAAVVAAARLASF